MEHVSEFLREFKDCPGIIWKGEGEQQDALGLINNWSQYMRDLMIELFNSFVYGNLISVSAMTRTLIESYLYLRILLKENSGRLLGEWFLCSLLTGKKFEEEDRKKIYDIMENICLKYGMDAEDCRTRFEKGRENDWLTEVIGKRRISIRDLCEYLGEDDVLRDYKSACSYVHAQDIVTKIMPFTFYSSIYHKLYMMMTYIFRTVSLYPVSDEQRKKMEALEAELIDLAEKYI